MKEGLYWAAANGHPSVVEYFIARGVDIAEMESDPVWPASYLGHFNAVKLLMESGANMERDNDGFRPIHAAAKKGHLNIVKLLIEQAGVTYSARQLTNLAKANGHLDIVQYLKCYIVE